MIGLVGLLTFVALATATPIFRYGYDLPYTYHHYASSILHPYTPAVTRVIPGVYPYHYNLPYYTGLKSQYDERDFYGQARYGHVEPGQSHHAVQDAFGNKAGSFSYYDADGKLKHTSYIANSAGYRVASNNLPEDTPEVAAAKIAHLVEVEKVKSRSRRDIIVPGSTTAIVSPISLHRNILPLVPHVYPTTITGPVVRPDGYLADTPEVTAAKILHSVEVEAAKARVGVVASPISRIVPLVPHAYPTTITGPVVKPDGFLADTPEVTAAKINHAVEVEAAKARVVSPFTTLVSPTNFHYDSPISRVGLCRLGGVWC